MPLASSLHLSRPPGIGFLLNSLNFVFKLQSIGTWLVGFSSSVSTEFDANSSSWLRRFVKLVSFLFNGVFDVVGISLTLASKLKTESSDTYSVVSGRLGRDFFLSEVNRSLEKLLTLFYDCNRHGTWYNPGILTQWMDFFVFRMV